MVGMDVPLLPSRTSTPRPIRIPELVDRNTEPPRPACRYCAIKTRTFISANLSTVSASAPMPTARCRLTYATSSTRLTFPRPSMPSMLPFTDEDFAQPWEQCKLLSPAWKTKVDSGFNGIFSFTPDGGPLIGEIFRRRRVLDRRGRVGHPRRVSLVPPRNCWSTDAATSTCTTAMCTASKRFSSHRTTSARRPSRISSRSTTSCIRSSPGCRRVICGSVPHVRQKELGAVFLERRLGGPHWYKANAGLVQQLPPEWVPPARDAWAARFHSPIAAAEAWRTRTSVAMYDMTPLKRLEISGPAPCRSCSA